MADVVRSPRVPGALRVAGSLLAILSFVFLGSRLIGQLRELPPVRWSGMAVGAILATIALVVAIEAVHSLAWRILTRAVVPGATWRESFVLCGRSQIAKYIPGNAFHYLQRIVLLHGAGLGTVEASVLTVVDAVLLAVAGVLVGLPALEHAFRSAVPASGSIPIGLTLAAIVVLVAGGTVLAAPRARERLRQAARVLSPNRLVSATVLNAVSLVLAGVSMHLMLQGFWPGISPLGWLDFIPGFALAFVVGFVTPGAPGGIGVREMVLYGLYAPTLGSGLAAGLFLLLRVTYILGDTATFVVATLIQTAPARRVSARPDSP